MSSAAKHDNCSCNVAGKGKEARLTLYQNTGIEEEEEEKRVTTRDAQQGHHASLTCSTELTANANLQVIRTVAIGHVAEAIHRKIGIEGNGGNVRQRRLEATAVGTASLSSKQLNILGITADGAFNISPTGAFFSQTASTSCSSTTQGGEEEGGKEGSFSEQFQAFRSSFTHLMCQHCPGNSNTPTASECPQRHHNNNKTAAVTAESSTHRYKVQCPGVTPHQFRVGCIRVPAMPQCEERGERGSRGGEHAQWLFIGKKSVAFRDDAAALPILTLCSTHVLRLRGSGSGYGCDQCVVHLRLPCKGVPWTCQWCLPSKSCRPTGQASNHRE